MFKFGRLLPTFMLGLAFAAPSFGEKLTVVPANEASRDSFQVNKRINWHKNIDEARQEAGKTGRMVFWVHMLGSMDGKT